MNKEIHKYNGKNYILVPDNKNNACDNCAFMIMKENINTCTRWDVDSKVKDWKFLQSVDCMDKDSVFIEHIPGIKRKLIL